MGCNLRGARLQRREPETFKVCLLLMHTLLFIFHFSFFFLFLNSGIVLYSISKIRPERSPLLIVMSGCNSNSADKLGHLGILTIG